MVLRDAAVETVCRHRISTARKRDAGPRHDQVQIARESADRAVAFVAFDVVRCLEEKLDLPTMTRARVSHLSSSSRHIKDGIPRNGGAIHNVGARAQYLDDVAAHVRGLGVQNMRPRKT
jgi:hypothetical protein